MTEHGGEIASVRERIARVEYEFHHPPDKELAWCRIKDEPRFASLVAVYYGRADAVLGAIGLEEMAGYCPMHGGIVAWEDGIATCDRDDGDEPCQVVPLYRLHAQSGSSQREVER